MFKQCSQLEIWHPARIDILGLAQQDHVTLEIDIRPKDVFRFSLAGTAVCQELAKICRQHRVALHSAHGCNQLWKIRTIRKGKGFRFLRRPCDRVMSCDIRKRRAFSDSYIKSQTKDIQHRIVLTGATALGGSHWPPCAVRHVRGRDSSQAMTPFLDLMRSQLSRIKLLQLWPGFQKSDRGLAPKVLCRRL